MLTNTCQYNFQLKSNKLYLNVKSRCSLLIHLLFCFVTREFECPGLCFVCMFGVHFKFSAPNLFLSSMCYPNVFLWFNLFLPYRHSSKYKISHSYAKNLKCTLCLRQIGKYL